MLGDHGKLLVWISEFLLSRTMCVKVAGNVCSVTDVTSGVQVSVLGLVLFLIYVNCVVSSVGCSWKVLLMIYKLHLSFSKDLVFMFCKEWCN